MHLDFRIYAIQTSSTVSITGGVAGDDRNAVSIQHKLDRKSMKHRFCHQLHNVIIIYINETTLNSI